MLKPVAVSLLAALPLFASSAHAETTTTEAQTLVVVTPNAPVIVQQGDAEAPPVVGGPSAQAPVAPAAVAANAAPQNENWNDVSHINGVPVKVGERNQYLYKFKKNNISANPFGPFFGYYDISFSHALGQNLAASIAVSGWDMSDGYTQGYQIAASLPLYFRRTFQGPYLEGGLLVRTDTSNDYYAYGYTDCYDCMTYDSSDSWVGPELLFGWHWTFDSGLNVAAAFGVARQLGHGSDETEANGYFRVGYAF